MKTQLNPDPTARYRNMRILLKALPPVNHAVLRSVLELFRLILHHRRKNKLTVSGFCQELGPIILGVDKSPQNAQQASQDLATAADVLKTLITQYQFLVGNTDEPAEYDSLPLFTKKSKHVLLTHTSRARGLIAKQRASASLRNQPFISSHNSLGSHTQQMMSLGAPSKGPTFGGVPPSSSSAGIGSGIGSYSTSSLPAPTSFTHHNNVFGGPVPTHLNGSHPSLGSVNQLPSLHGTSAPMLFAHLNSSSSAATAASGVGGPISPETASSPLVIPTSGAQSVPANGSPLAGMALSPPSAASFLMSSQPSNSPSSSLGAFSPMTGSAQAVPFVPLSFPLNSSQGTFSSAGSGAGLNASSASNLSQQHPQLQHQLSISSSNSDEAEELISLTDGIMSKFLDQTVRTVLFEPQVRISFNYEAKIPNQLKRNYTLDKWSEMQRGTSSSMEPTLRQGAWRPSLEDEIPGSGLITGRRRRDSNREDSLADGDARFRRNTTTARPSDYEAVPSTSRVHTVRSGGADDDHGGSKGDRESHPRSEKETRAEREARHAAEKEAKSDREKSDREKSDGRSDREGSISLGHGADGGESSGSTSSRRRSRRVSVTQDDSNADGTAGVGTLDPKDRTSAVRRMSVDSSYSDEIAGRRHVSADHLSEIDSLSMSDSDVETNGSDDVGKLRRVKKSSKREEQMNRRASASKVTTGTKSKINTSGKERRRRTTLGNDPSDEIELASEGPSAHSTSTISTSSHERSKSSTMKTQRRSKPPQILLDSKTIMEMAPSPPSEMPPPLTPAPSTTTTTTNSSVTTTTEDPEP